ncbi:unnamed protein product [Wuchereria bancrofti]|uniref:Uncharacterized protein n=1 Tax=Wuchereria bancrofti TaxID=6293 RepID=A0A3P7DYP1_WUCBA|nr:unnamed protein product [Wuchereria bancrofti]
MGPMAMGMVHREVRVVVLQHNNSTGIIINSITAIPSLSSSSGRVIGNNSNHKVEISKRNKATMLGEQFFYLNFHMKESFQIILNN